MAHSGKRFGALGRSTDASKTLKIVSKDGLILAYNRLTCIKRMVTFADLLVDTYFSCVDRSDSEKQQLYPYSTSTLLGLVLAIGL